MTNLEIVTAMTGSDNTALLTALLADAEERILHFTGRTHMIPQLNSAVRELAIISYNKLGSEGMTSRTDSEVGISSGFESIPATLQAQISRYRLCRVNGAFYETPETST